MDQYRLFTDSAVDMPHELYKKYDIHIVPMDYVLNGKEMVYFTDSPDHDKIADELFAAQKGEADVHTSQITPYRFEEYWRPELEAGNDILHITFSSGLSATADNAFAAAEQLREEFPDRKLLVVDSMAATSGQGVFVQTAAMNREKGMSIEENATWLKDHVKYLCHRFVVGDLNYLHKGGRVSKATAIVGSMLNIKPILIIDDEGKIPVIDKVRGRNKAWKDLIDTYVKKREGLPEDMPRLVYITHSSQYEDAEKLKELALKYVEEGTEIVTVTQGPIIGVHTGPDFFSFCGWGIRRN